MVTPITYKNLTIVPIPTEKIRRVGIVDLGGLTMGEWYARQEDKPDAMINGSLWDSKGAIGTIWKDGQLQRNEGGGDSQRHRRTCGHPVRHWRYWQRL